MSDTTALGYTPAFQFTNNGADLTGIFADRVLSIEVESVDGGGEGDKVKITIDDRGSAIGLPTVGDQSTTLSVALGYVQTGLYDQGTFTLDEIQIIFPPSSICFCGTSLGMNNNLKAPMMLANAGKTVADIVNGIAQTTGAGAVIDPSIGSATIPFLNQYSGSGQLLQWIERQYNGMAKFADGTLALTQRGTGTNASGQTVPVVALDAADFGSGQIKIKSRPMHSKVRASYWDAVNHQLKWVDNTNGSAGTSTVPYMIKNSLPSQAEAQAAANAAMSRFQQGISTGTVVLAKGDASIKGGYLISVTGVRDGVDGTYSISRATHLLTKAAGLITTLEIYSTGEASGSSTSSPTTPGTTAPTTPPTTGSSNTPGTSSGTTPAA